MITLLTDFGTYDEYVGVMKGTILSVNPWATIVDISHHIEAQDLFQTAYMLQAAYHYFSKGTIHVAVVDPGVGSNRRILAVKAGSHIFLVPDNGILTLVMNAEKIEKIIQVENSEYFLDSISQTFHGRDIFAPVAAHISKGLDIDRLGSPMAESDMIRLNIPKPYISDKNELLGVIVSVDRFGNLITNIDSASLESFCEPEMKKHVRLSLLFPSSDLGTENIIGLSQSYASVLPGKPLAIIGSRGYLEIAVNCGNAKSFFKAGKGEKIRIFFS